MVHPTSTCVGGVESQANRVQVCEGHFSGVQKVCKCIRVLYTGLECMLSDLEHL